jgi:hypothetical protein
MEVCMERIKYRFKLYTNAVDKAYDNKKREVKFWDISMP